MRSEAASQRSVASRDVEADGLDVGLAIALPLAMTALAGCAYHFLHQHFLVRTRLGPMGLLYSPYLTLIPSFSLCGWYGGSSGKNGLWASMVGGVVAVVATMNFRGSFYWPGTFDMSETSLFHTVAPMGIGLFVGLALAAVRPMSVAKGRIGALAISLVALAWCWIDAHRNIGMYSLSSYSLHLGLLASYVAALVAAILVRFASE